MRSDDPAQRIDAIRSDPAPEPLTALLWPIGNDPDPAIGARKAWQAGRITCPGGADAAERGAAIESLFGDPDAHVFHDRYREPPSGVTVAAKAAFESTQLRPQGIIALRGRVSGD
jgi:hypothetical protein